MPLHTALFFVQTGVDERSGIHQAVKRKTKRLAVASDVVEDLDARRADLEKAHGCGFPRWTFVDFSPHAFWDGVFTICGGSCRAWMFENLTARNVPEARRDTFKRAGVEYVPLPVDQGEREPPVVWTADDKLALAMLGIEHFRFEFHFGCVFAGDAGPIERDLQSAYAACAISRLPKLSYVNWDSDFIEAAAEEALVCLLPYGAHGNEDIALASSTRDAGSVARGMATAASEYGIESRVLFCTQREYELWSHDTKLPDCECETIAPDTSKPVAGPARPGLGTLARHPLQFDGPSEES